MAGVIGGGGVSQIGTDRFQLSSFQFSVVCNVSETARVASTIHNAHVSFVVAGADAAVADAAAAAVAGLSLSLCLTSSSSVTITVNRYLCNTAAALPSLSLTLAALLLPAQSATTTTTSTRSYIIYRPLLIPTDALFWPGQASLLLSELYCAQLMLCSLLFCRLVAVACVVWSIQ